MRGKRLSSVYTTQKRGTWDCLENANNPTAARLLQTERTTESSCFFSSSSFDQLLHFRSATHSRNKKRKREHVMSCAGPTTVKVPTLMQLLNISEPQITVWMSRHLCSRSSLITAHVSTVWCSSCLISLHQLLFFINSLFSFFFKCVAGLRCRIRNGIKMTKHEQH